MVSVAIKHEHSNAEMSSKDIDRAYVESDREFQGDVRMRVEATDQIRTVMLFVSELRLKYHFRVLELNATVRDGVYIRMNITKPNPLIMTLRQNELVSKVEASQGEVMSGNEPVVHVQLVG